MKLGLSLALALIYSVSAFADSGVAVTRSAFQAAKDVALGKPVVLSNGTIVVLSSERKLYFLDAAGGTVLAQPQAPVSRFGVAQTEVRRLAEDFLAVLAGETLALYDSRGNAIGDSISVLAGTGLEGFNVGFIRLAANASGSRLAIALGGDKTTVGDDHIARFESRGAVRILGTDGIDKAPPVPLDGPAESLTQAADGSFIVTTNQGTVLGIGADGSVRPETLTIQNGIMGTRSRSDITCLSALKSGGLAIGRWGANRLEFYGADWQQVSTFGFTGQKLHIASSACRLTGTGNLVVDATANGLNTTDYAHVFTAEGKLLKVLQIEGNPAGFATAADGSYAIAYHNWHFDFANPLGLVIGVLVFGPGALEGVDFKSHSASSGIHVAFFDAENNLVAGSEPGGNDKTQAPSFLAGGKLLEGKYTLINNHKKGLILDPSQPQKKKEAKELGDFGGLDRALSDGVLSNDSKQIIYVDSKDRVLKFVRLK